MPPFALQPLVVALFITLPWLNPLAPGPVPSVFPWLLTAWLVCTAVIVSAPLAQQRLLSSRRATSAITLAILSTLAWAAMPREAAATSYELLALAGGLVLIALGALLARQAKGATIAGRPWAYWCALWPWLAAGLISCVLALLQYTGHASPLVPWVNWAPPGEAYANLRQRNQFASLTNIALAALLAWRVLPRRTTDPSRASEFALAAALALLAIGNAASSSRTGLLQLVCICAAVLFWRRDRRVLMWMVWTLACYAIGVLGLPWAIGLDPSLHGMFSRLRAGDAVCSSRLTLWNNVLDLIALRPWRGWGWGELDYAHYMTLYDGPRFCDILDNAHNLPLQIAVELGLPSALLAGGALLAWVVLRRPWRETDPLRQMAWLVLGVILLHSLLEYPLWYGPFQLVFGLCLGLLWPGAAGAGASAEADTGAEPGAGRSPRRTSVATALPRAAAVLLLAGVAYAAWDYTRISQLYLARADRLAPWRDDTLDKLRASWLFASQVRFAELSMTAVTPADAAAVHALAQRMLHFSPEPRVIARLIDSARLLGRDDEAAALAARFEAAFPVEHARWRRDRPPPAP
ncbi:MAG TPA: Wzy polymerase domain-containing protein [Variovorax sp.]|nr:Wzy polymerase domain-containing protein [Variovorax sp.]